MKGKPKENQTFCLQTQNVLCLGVGHSLDSSLITKNLNFLKVEVFEGDLSCIVLKGILLLQNRFFFLLIPVPKHNSKTKTFENVPSTVLASSFTVIGQIVYRYWPKYIPVLAKSYISIPTMFYANYQLTQKK